MKQLICKVNIVFLLCFTLISLPTLAQEKTGKVIAVLDGDTIELLDEESKNTVRIRLKGIDAPEKNQPFGQKSKQYLADLCFGKTVGYIVSDIDRYGRKIADVYLLEPHKNQINRIMVANGMAWHYSIWSTDENLAFLQNYARRNKIGLWNDKNPVPPWEFRKKK